MDLDIKLKKDITWIVNTTDYFAGIIHFCSLEELNNALFASKPNHPIVNNVIRKFKE